MSNASRPQPATGPRPRDLRRSRSRFRRAWPCWSWRLLLVVAAVLLAGLGILRRSHADTVLAERTQELARAHGYCCGARQSRRAGRQLCVAGQRDGIHRLAHLRPHHRVPDPLVLRHRRKSEEGRAAGGDRNARTGSATLAGAEPTWLPHRPTPTTPASRPSATAGW